MGIYARAKSNICIRYLNRVGFKVSIKTTVVECLAKEIKMGKSNLKARLLSDLPEKMAVSKIGSLPKGEIPLNTGRNCRKLRDICFDTIRAINIIEADSDVGNNQLEK